jgi:hypothetical protein
VEPLQKIKVYDSRVDAPAFYDTFAEFQYSYHYGDMLAPRLQQAEPLKVECQHFLDCIETGKEPLSSGRQGLELVRILEASTLSLRNEGARVPLDGDLNHRDRFLPVDPLLIGRGPDSRQFMFGAPASAPGQPMS